MRDLAYKALQIKDRIFKETQKEATIEQIAKELFLHISSIGKWRKKYNLPCNNKFHIRDTAKMELYNQGLNDRQMAKKLNCSISCVNSWRFRRGLPNNNRRNNHDFI